MQWSDEVYRIFGYEPGDVRPSYEWLLSRVVPDDRPLLASSLEGALREDRLFNIDYRIVTPGGATRYVHIVADRIKRDKADNPQWMYGIVQDITNRKLTEIALQDAKAEAELYLDLMSHDINNMNQIGIGYLEMALGKPQDMSDEVREMLVKPLEALESSSQLIKNVTKLQRAREGEFQTTRINIGELVDKLLPRCSSAGRDIHVNYHGCDCYVMANELLSDVFSNIIGNAIKHSEGPLVIDIDVKKAREDGREYCVVSVADNGPGIPDSLKQKLFVRFQRGTAKTSGRGLGLYLVKTLIDAYHGKVRVEDRVPGDYTKGAKFVVMLPVA
jgi:PAS domain S-box-containing protein